MHELLYVGRWVWCPTSNSRDTVYHRRDTVPWSQSYDWLTQWKSVDSWSITDSV